MTLIASLPFTLAAALCLSHLRRDVPAILAAARAYRAQFAQLES